MTKLRSIYNNLYSFFEKPFKFDILDSVIKRKDRLFILDIGCGNYSPSCTKKFYARCQYYGLDRRKKHNLNKADFDAMDGFYEEDLDVSELTIIPNNFFNVVIFCHVVEHLREGERALARILQKVKDNGVIYCEFPHPSSIYFPKVRGPFFDGTLNFYDDRSHVRMYIRKDLEKILDDNEFAVLKSGRRHFWKRIAFLPAYFIVSLVAYKQIKLGIFWDILGFSDYILARKKVHA